MGGGEFVRQVRGDGRADCGRLAHRAGEGETHRRRCHRHEGQAQDIDRAGARERSPEGRIDVVPHLNVSELVLWSSKKPSWNADNKPVALGLHASVQEMDEGLVGAELQTLDWRSWTSR